MSQPPNGRSVWGDIDSCMEIAPNIYMVIANADNGIEYTGVMARRSTAEKKLSPKAVALAVQDGDWLCYDEYVKDIPIYEVLQHRVAACKRIEAAAVKEIFEIKRYGKLSLTDYFGECIPPTESQHGIINNVGKVCNGLYFIHDVKGLQFAVHNAVSDLYMSPFAIALGQRKWDYVFYDISGSAIAINELKNTFSAVEGLIVSIDSLYSTLNKNFPAYVALYNEIMQGDSLIPKVDAPMNLFLSIQIEVAKQNDRLHSTKEQTKQSAPNDVNEGADCEIEK